MELEISDGAYPTFVPSVELSFTQLGSSWVSAPVASNLQKNDSSNFHTIQIAVTNYKGTISAMVSLEYDSMGNYFPVKFVNDSFNIDFNNETDVQGWNFIADARWVKIMYTPAADNTGTVDKVLYRS